MISLAAVVSTTVFPVVESITTPFFSSRAISTDPLLREILESFVTGVADVTVISFAFVCFAESAATTVILTVFVVLPALTVIVAFNDLALPFLGVTLTQYLDWNNLWKCDKMWIFP
ncbi:MAG: hypothetical protein MR663_07125 [Lachnospiraceae bacterium]|nr:hypothetical protein [Lachnospiraceae bacterium]